jgi:hypothetical protein
MCTVLPLGQCSIMNCSCRQRVAIQMRLSRGPREAPLDLSTTVPRVHPGHLIHAPNRLTQEVLRRVPKYRGTQDLRRRQTYLSRRVAAHCVCRRVGETVDLLQEASLQKALDEVSSVLFNHVLGRDGKAGRARSKQDKVASVSWRRTAL